ncbi:MAG: Excinuclease subunit domain protein [Candidatus Kaiserbacteria bacterium]|nr:Excinuclease subunit domain protein [Candidatus Kaiserbacteria bacterium]
MYYVYIVQCRDESLYTGITTDTKRRVHEHNTSKKAAQYTKSRRPVTLVFAKKCSTRSVAQKYEYRIKNLTREEKMILIAKKRISAV